MSYEEERALPRAHRHSNRRRKLTPEPPRGWWMMATYTTDIAPEPRDLAAWIVAVADAQHWSKQSGGRQHMLARTKRGTRVLLVHPDQRERASELIEGLNMTITQCNCGGADCLFPNFQQAGARVFAKRAWSCVSTMDRLEVGQTYAENNGTDLPFDLMAGPEVLDDIEDPFLLYELSQLSSSESFVVSREAVDEVEEPEQLRRAA